VDNNAVIDSKDAEQFPRSKLRLRREVFAGIDKNWSRSTCIVYRKAAGIARPPQQFFMSAALDNLTAFQHQDLIGNFGIVESLCAITNVGAPTSKLTQSVLNQGFTFAFQAGSCLVKDQQFGVGEKARAMAMR